MGRQQGGRGTSWDAEGAPKTAGGRQGCALSPAQVPAVGTRNRRCGCGGGSRPGGNRDGTGNLPAPKRGPDPGAPVGAGWAAEDCLWGRPRPHLPALRSLSAPRERGPPASPVTLRWLLRVVASPRPPHGPRSLLERPAPRAPSRSRPGTLALGGAFPSPSASPPVGCWAPPGAGRLSPYRPAFSALAHPCPLVSCPSRQGLRTALPSGPRLISSWVVLFEICLKNVS